MNQASVKSSTAWEVLVEDWSSSGLSQKAFCDQRGVSFSNFMKERSRLIKLGVGPPSARVVAAKGSPTKSFSQFIPVSVESPLPPPAATPEIVIELPLGVVIRFRGIRQ